MISPQMTKTIIALTVSDPKIKHIQIFAVIQSCACFYDIVTTFAQFHKTLQVVLTSFYTLIEHKACPRRSVPMRSTRANMLTC